MITLYTLLKFINTSRLAIGRYLGFAIVVLLFFFNQQSFAQVGTQAPSIQSGVTFQFSDKQDGNNENPATIESITVDGVVFGALAVPSNYQLTRLGPGGEDLNRTRQNGAGVIGTSETSTLDINDSNPWDDAAIAAFQDRNLNHYFESPPERGGNGDDICEDFDSANGTNGVTETDAQMQTIFYDPPIPVNDGGILAVTERGGNNCYYVRVRGIPVGGVKEQVLGDTFVRTRGNLLGGGFSPPAIGSDYWGSGREQDNGQTIAIALFELENIVTTGSLITSIEFLGATNDHGDGKFFLIQEYAMDSEEEGCENNIINGDLDTFMATNVPPNSTFTLLNGPTPAGASFDFNTDGTFTYEPETDFVGSVTFEYEVCLPAPNTDVCDTATVTLFVNPNPQSPQTSDIAVCALDNIQTITATADVPDGVSVVWFDAPTGGNIVPDPSLNSIGTVTFYAEALNDLTGCTSEPPRSPATLTLFDCGINLVKTGDFNDENGDGVAQIGETINYTFTVTNGGDAPISDVVISDPLFEVPNPVVPIVFDGGDTDGDDELDVDETWLFSAAYTITQEDIDAGQVENQALVVGNGPDGTEVSDESDDDNPLEDDPTITILPEEGGLSVIKSQASVSGTGGLGDTISFDIVVTNTGDVTLTDIVVTDDNATITGGSPIASLAPGASATVTAEHVITQDDIDAGFVENTAIATGEDPSGNEVTDTSDAGTDVDGNPIENPEDVETPDGNGDTNGDPTDDPTVTDIDQASSISVIKSQTSVAGGIGDTISYSIWVTNTGNTTITNIEITDANATITGGNPIASLAPGNTVLVTAEHVITQDDINAGFVENTAIATGEDPSGNEVSDTSDAGTDVAGNPIENPEGVETPDGNGDTNGDPTDDPTVTGLNQDSSLSVIKNQTSVAGDLGDTISYSIWVTNTGNTTITDIVVTDANATITGGSPIAILEPGNTVLVTAEHVITQDDINTGFVENTAIATGEDPSGNEVSDTSDAGTDVDGNPIENPEDIETPDGLSLIHI